VTDLGNQIGGHPPAACAARRLRGRTVGSSWAAVSTAS
jgi:hypothetical protein